jgi:WhiB family redox-sensing transcriptional regulator
MFASEDQKADLKKLLDAQWEADEIAPCTNYPDAYFPELASDALDIAEQARKMCNGCPIIEQCFQYAIKWEIHGVWGGTTANQRKMFRRAAKLPIPSRVPFHDWAGEAS